MNIVPLRRVAMSASWLGIGKVRMAPTEVQKLERGTIDEIFVSDG